MKFWVSRAMQIVTMDKEEIERIHKIEKKVGYCIPNWNIQILLGSQSIKSVFNIPHDEQSQSAHSFRVEHDLLKINIFRSMENQAKIAVTKVDETHSFDWAVFNRQSEITWQCLQSKRGKRAIAKIFE